MLTEWSNQPTPVRTYVFVCALLELMALAGTVLGFGEAVRYIMIALGGFWPDLLRGAAPAYSVQPFAMFASCVFLHGGLLHLFMNMVGLMWLGPIVINRVGERAFWPIVGLCALGAGAAYAVLSASGVPMVGASGVLFGFIGVVGTWALLDRVKRRETLRPLIEQALVFTVLNIALALLSGVIAWQAHVGGFAAGVVCGLLTWSRPAGPLWS